MKTYPPFLLIGLSLTLVNCNNAHMSEDYIADYSNEKTFISSSAAIENPSDTTRKFIRTADLKFKVKSVIESTYAIEETAVRLGGFVTLTNLSATVNAVNTVAISADSSLEIKNYTVHNTITLRVPNTRLDSVLKEISKNIDFLDYRIIKAEDVALEILSNKLVQKRSTQNEERLTNAINSQGKKLKETTIAEGFLSNKKDQKDNAILSNLSLSDQINYSTINLAIYQRPSVSKELISNNKNVDAYQPRLGSKLFEALKFGWKIVEALLLFLANIWTLLLIGFALYILLKKNLSRNSK